MDEHKILAELQKIDSKIDALNYQEKNLPERDRFQSLSEEVGKTESLYKTVSEKLHDELLKQKKLEDELDSLTKKIDKEQGRLYSGTINNPKELSSVQQEINHLKGLVDEKETALLEQLDVVDALKKNNETIADRLATRKAEMSKAKEGMDAGLAEIKAERDKLQSERKPFYSSLSDGTRQLYDRVRTNYPLAVTILEGNLCQGCRVELPSTEAERIGQSKNLEKCPECGRIIVKV